MTRETRDTDIARIAAALDTLLPVDEPASSMIADNGLWLDRSLATPFARALYDAGLRPSVEPGGLDAAWNEAEAALPDGWAIGMVWGTVTSERWGAMAGPWPSKQGESHEFGGGDTPAAALRQLASRLAERNPRTGELTLDQLRARSKDVSPLLPTQASDSPEKP